MRALLLCEDTFEERTLPNIDLLSPLKRRFKWGDLDEVLGLMLGRPPSQLDSAAEAVSDRADVSHKAVAKEVSRQRDFTTLAYAALQVKEPLGQSVLRMQHLSGNRPQLSR